MANATLALEEAILKAANMEPLTRGQFAEAIRELSDLKYKADEYDRVMGELLSGKFKITKRKEARK